MSTNPTPRPASTTPPAERSAAAIHRSKKRCPKCGKTQDLETGFHKNGAVGYRSPCKRCAAETSREWRESHRAQVAATRASWRRRNPDKVAAAQAKYAKANLERLAGHSAAHRKRHPRRAAARKAVSVAIHSGRLAPEPCARCGLAPRRANGRQRIEAHHWKGYDPEFWLDVQWLCKPHHAEADALGDPWPMRTTPEDRAAALAELERMEP